MSCPDCEDHATPEQILELIERHHNRMEAEYTARLDEAVAEIRRLTDTLAAGTIERPLGTQLH